MKTSKKSGNRKAEVEDIKRLSREYPVVGVVDLSNLPAFQLLRIKTQLKNTIVLKFSKKRLMKIAFADLAKENKGLEVLSKELKGVPALIFTKEDPFKLGKLLQKSKSPAAAKPGQEAPNDLVIPAGPTQFAPGPMIGELGQMGIKSKVEGGKIVILDDHVLVKDGEVISEKAAGLLSKMGIEPMEIGINLLLTFKDGEILRKEVLFVDEKEYIDNLKLAAGESINLAVYCSYMTKETAEILIKKAALEKASVEKEVGELKVEEKKEEKVEEPKMEEPEKPKEPEVEEQPVEEPEVVEEPEPEPEPVEETPVEPESVEEPIEEIKEEPKVEVKEEDLKQIEKDKNPTPYTDDAVKKAQEVLQQVVDNKIAKEDKYKARVPTAEELKKKKEPVEKKDIKELVNELKDKKSRGEI